MDFLQLFNPWYFNSYEDVTTWIIYGGAAWTVVVFVFNIIFSIIYDFVKGGRH